MFLMIGVFERFRLENGEWQFLDWNFGTSKGGNFEEGRKWDYDWLTYQSFYVVLQNHVNRLIFQVIKCLISKHSQYFCFRYVLFPITAYIWAQSVKFFLVLQKLCFKDLQI